MKFHSKIVNSRLRLRWLHLEKGFKRISLELVAFQKGASKIKLNKTKLN